MTSIFCAKIQKKEETDLKKRRRWVAFLMACLVLAVGIPVLAEGTVSTQEGDLYERMRQACLDGKGLEDWVVEGRRQIAEELGLTEHLDENNYLSVEYQNQHQLGRSEPISDEKLDLLVEMGTKDDEFAVLMMGMVQPLADTTFATGDTVSVTQKARLSGAGNGYFTISGAESYGYCAQNSKDFWNNNTSKSGTIKEWNNAEVRKALYYGPGGPGYSDNYYGSKGADMDYVTFAIGQINGDTANNTKATTYRDKISGKSDPLSKGYRAFKVDIASPYQDVAFLAYVPTEGKAQVIKTSANTAITNDNDCYSLEGAVFGVYSASSCSSSSKVGTLTTKANGKTGTSTLDAGTYYVKETTAPKGYALNTTVYKVKVVADETATVTISNQPQLDPVGILLGKVDAATNQNKPQGSATLEGAQFTVKYYKVSSTTDPALAGETPARKWVLQTDEDGFCYLDDEWKVSGDAFYLSSAGVPSLPLGTITIQETKAPEGYHINSEVFVRQITAEGAAEGVETYNYPIIKEKIFQLQLTKVDDKGNVLAGAQFTHTKPDGTTEVLTTNANGKLTIKGLEYGTHKLQETKAPEGYRLDYTVFQFTVKNNNTISDFSITKDGQLVTDVYTYEINSNDNLIVKMVNETRVKLPSTGSAMPIVLLTGSVAICTMLIIKRKNKIIRER